MLPLNVSVVVLGAEPIVSVDASAPNFESRYVPTIIAPLAGVFSHCKVLLIFLRSHAGQSQGGSQSFRHGGSFLISPCSMAESYSISARASSRKYVSSRSSFIRPLPSPCQDSRQSPEWGLASLPACTA